MAYFGTNQTGDEEDDPWSFLDAAPTIPAPLPLTDTETDEETVSVRSAPASTAPSKESAPVKCKPLISTQKDLLEDLCTLHEAICVYPQDKDFLKETGIPEQYLVKQEHQTTYKVASVYLCPHPKCQTPTYWTQSPSAMYSHLLCKHLGLALACPYCKEKVFWNSKGWKAHMDSKHKGLPAYSTNLQDKAKYAQALLSSVQQDVATPSPFKKHCRASPATVKEDTPTEDSSSDSDTTDSDDPDASEPLTEGKTSATPLEASDIPEDLPPLEETPPAPFPKHAKSHRKDQWIHFPLLGWTELSFIVLFIFLFSKGVLSRAQLLPPPLMYSTSVFMFNKYFLEKYSFVSFSVRTRLQELKI